LCLHVLHGARQKHEGYYSADYKCFGFHSELIFTLQIYIFLPI
jgi:hypothetical protein